MEEPRRLRKRDMRITKTKFVFGYPRPRFEIVSDSEEEEEYDEDDEEGESEGEGTGERVKTEGGKSRKTETPRTARTAKTRATNADDSEYDSEDYDSEDYDDGDDEEDFLPFKLPQIGYPKTPSLPPSSQSFRSRYMYLFQHSWLRCFLKKARVDLVGIIVSYFVHSYRLQQFTLSILMTMKLTSLILSLIAQI